jgi:hypothetical protein
MGASYEDMNGHQYAKAVRAAKSERNEANRYCKHAAAKTKRESKRELARSSRRHERTVIVDGLS